MTLDALLQQLASQCVELWFEGDRLRFRAPEGALSPTLRAQLIEHKSAILARMRADASEVVKQLPLSFSQRSLWFVQQEDPASCAYNVCFSTRVVAPLDEDALRGSLQALYDRHASLRSTFPMVDGMPVQRVSGYTAAVLELRDAHELDSAELHQAVKAAYRRPFDLESGPVFRTTVFRRRGRGDILLLTVHHIAADGWSILQLIEELAALYRQATIGTALTLPRPAIEYESFAAWQNDMLAGEPGRRMGEFWQAQMAAPRSVLELPLDRPRPLSRSTSGATFTFGLDLEGSERIRRLARENGTTVYVVMLAAFETLLFRYSGVEDLIVGTPVFGRNRPEFARVVGDFVNTVPLRVRLDAQLPFRDLMQRVQQTLFGALENQDYPFALIVEQAQPRRDASRSPLFDVLFVLQRFDQLRDLEPILMPEDPDTTVEFGGLRLANYALDSQEGQFDLTLQVIDRPGAFLMQFKYSSTLFKPETISRWSGHLRCLLEAAVADCSQPVGLLPLLTAAESDALVRTLPATVPACPPRTLQSAFEACARATPSAIAVSCGEQSLSYDGLNRRANQLAHRLRTLGVVRDTVVGLYTERSLDSVVALLGILKAGGAYLPLDPSYPIERLSFMLKDASPPVLVTQRSLADTLPSCAAEVVYVDDDLRQYDEHDPSAITQVDDLAYVIYTSGSTGLPKGTLMTHRAVDRLFTSTECWYDFGARDVWTLFHSIAFDFSVWEFWGALRYGGRLVVVPYLVSRSPELFRDLLKREGVTVLNQTPSAFQQLLQVEQAVEDRGSLALRFVIFGGEALELQSLRHWFECYDDGAPQLVNMYGITETCVHVTYRRISHADLQSSGSPIGIPIPDLRLLLLDERQQPVPTGVPGEIYVGGPGLARGYLNRPALTSARFVDDPFTTGERLYRTGDLAVRRDAQVLEYLGRLDHQVKIRGFRIELGEIEAALAQCPGVQQSVVIVREDTPGNKRLVAYVVGAGDEISIVGGARSRLRDSLPDYMIPAAFVLLERLPLTSNGKVDRSALPPVPTENRHTHLELAPAQTPVEQALERIWCELLAVDKVGRDENFFELGGHSMLIVKMLVAMRAIGLKADVRTVFTHPTIAELGSSVGSIGAESMPIPDDRSGISDGCTEITPAMLPLAQLSREEIKRIVAEVPGGTANVQDIYPLMQLQEGVLFHQQMQTPGDGDIYQGRGVLTFRDRALLDAFLLALQAVVARHDALRTAIIPDAVSRPMQVVYRQASIPVTELQLAAGSDPASALLAASDPRKLQLDITRAPLAACFIARQADSVGWMLTLVMHHMVVDHTSLDLLLKEMQIIIADEQETLQPPVALRAFVAHSDRQYQHEEYFRSLLKGVEEPTLLSGQQDIRSASLERAEASVRLGAHLSNRVRTAAFRMGASPAALCHLAWALLLGQRTGKDDVVFGTVLSGRSSGEAGIDRVVGMFINTLPFRLRLRQGTVREAVQTVGRQLADLSAHERASLIQAQRCSAIAPGRSLFNSLLNYRRSHTVVDRQNPEGSELIDGVRKVLSEDRTSYPVSASVDELTGEFVLTLQTTPEFDPRPLVRDLNAMLQALVSAMGSDAEVPLHTLLKSVAPVAMDSARAMPDEPGEVFIGLFKQRAASLPDSVAVTCGEESLTYRALDRQATDLARRLRAVGVQRGNSVALLLGRSSDLLVALLAVQKSGGVYVPLDPDFPAERLSFMLQDSGARVLLTKGATASSMELPASVRLLDIGQEGAALELFSQPEDAVRVSADDPAYIIYTSGSTGRPKGVVVSHGGLSNLLQSMAREPGLSAQDVMGAVTTISFDIAGLELYLPLLVGARIELIDRETASDGAALASRLAAGGVTVLQATPATWRLLVEAGWQASEGFRAFCGGEALPRELANALLDRVTELWNLYGPTETTIWSTAGRIERSEGAISIGRPIANTQVYIVDKEGEPVPIGVPGEIWIGGAGVALGYHDRPQLTAERFLGDRFAGHAGARLYRTGDLGRWREDGRIEHLGRIDHQVKIRGYRVELGEIEARLNAHEAVRQAVVVAREAAAGDMRLIAYTQYQPGEELTVSEVRRYLRRDLPDYMIPSLVVPVESIPLTPNGKINRAALPDVSFETIDEPLSKALPRTPTERTLAEIWASVIGVERVDRSDGFFELGGHSLLAMQVVSQVRKSYSIELPVRALFESPTLEAFASIVDHALAKEHGIPPIPPLTSISSGAAAPLSFAQERMWLIQSLVPDNVAYNLPAAIRLTGALDLSALSQAIDELRRRHVTLRTTYRLQDGSPVQDVEDWKSESLVLVDLRSEAAAAAQKAMALAESEARQAFDLASGPPMRSVVYRIADHDHLLLVTMHHIACDQWSLGLLSGELASLYNALHAGRAVDLPLPAVSYRDFAVWQRKWLQGDLLQRQSAYWMARLDGLQPLELPTDRPRPAMQTYSGASLSVRLAPDLIERIEHTARREGATLFMVMFAAFVALLHRLGGQTDLAVGVPIANRNHQDIEELIGVFINTLVLRVDLSDQPSFRELLRRVRSSALEAYAHQDVPFEQLVERIGRRDPARAPLAQVLFNVQNARVREMRFDGLAWHAVLLERAAAQADLNFMIDTQVTHCLNIEYSADLFERRTIERWASQYIEVLESAVGRPETLVSALSLISRAECEQMREWSSGSKVAIRTEDVFPLLFERQVSAAPDAIAISLAGGSLSYRELNARANRLQRRLHELDVGPGVAVGLCMPRDADLLVALLAVQKSGGVYVPLDPDFPAERLSFMLQDSGARVLLTKGATASSMELPASVRLLDIGQEGAALELFSQPEDAVRVSADDPAYIIYTSGSTGRPKGVVVSHGGLSNLLQSMAREPGLSAQDVMGAVTTISFDIAGLELYLPLLVGARIELIDRETASDGAALASRLAAGGVTVLQATPATWRLLVEAGWQASEGFRAFCGGEALPRELANALLDRVTELWNLYGPTETTIWSTAGRVERSEGAISIGRPIANTQVYIVDKEGEPVPIGVPGEIWIGGAGVALGYHDRPQLTAERFLGDRFAGHAGARLYRTGDLGRWREDGRIEHLGRIDHQVKIRGYRVELGEIEARLNAHEAVRQAVVVAREAAAGDMRLIAYTQYQPGEELTVSEVRRYLRRDLPDYMIPSLVVPMESIPLTPNGKINRAALPDPLAQSRAADTQDSALATPMEHMIGELWRELLKVDRINADDNFFELGGHSLLTLRVAAAVEKRTGWRMDARTHYFQNLRQIAATVSSGAPHKIQA